LHAEASLLRDERRVKGLAARLRLAQQQQQAIELGNQNPQVLIDNFRAQIDWLDQGIAAYDQALANLGPTGGNQAATVQHNLLVDERNALVGEQRRLSGLIRELSGQRGQFREFKKQFNAEVARIRESYMQATSELRTAIDDALAKYTELGGNNVVSQALEDLTASLKMKQKLGPSKELANAIKWLAGIEGSIQRETVELHRNGGVDHVDVMLNGHGPIRMVFDTGAGPMTLPAELASRLSLKSTGRTVDCVVADGSKVAAKEMIIRSVTIGRMTVKNVTCVVMPNEKGDIAPLLGQSFLSRFDYRYTQGTGRLVLSKVEPNESAPARKGRTSKKPR
jgi:clan AA aspartic protease (TIGR02281 family)